MPQNMHILTQHLQTLAVAYGLSTSEDYRYVWLSGFRLPPGFNYRATDVLLTLPGDYPLSPPGIGDSRVYVSPHLRFAGRRLQDLHENVTPGWGDWAWLCYQRIDWHPWQDDLAKFLEMVRADLTNPPTT